MSTTTSVDKDLILQAIGFTTTLTGYIENDIAIENADNQLSTVIRLQDYLIDTNAHLNALYDAYKNAVRGRWWVRPISSST